MLGIKHTCTGVCIEARASHHELHDEDPRTALSTRLSPAHQSSPEGAIEVKVRFLLVACVTAALIIGSGVSPVAAAEVDPLAWTEWMSTTRIAYDFISLPPGHSWSSPDVQGDWVVWQVASNPPTDWNVYALNLKTRTRKTVSAGAGNQTQPRVHGSWIVYEDDRNGNLDVYAFNLTTSAEVQLTGRAGHQRYPDISGSKIVYTDVAAGDIYLYDLSTGAESALPLGAGTQTTGRISGDRVVYMQDAEIYVYDLRSGVSTRITNDATDDYSPDIDGTVIAWQRWAGGSDIWCQDLAGGSAFGAVVTPDSEYFPRVSGSKIAYAANNAGNFNIGVFDLRTKKSVSVTGGPKDLYPSIDGDTVVYVSDYDSVNEGGNDVSLGRLIAPQLSASGPAGAVPYGSVVGISGSLVENGIPLGDMPIRIERSDNDGHTWSEVATGTTDANGGYAYSTPKLYRKAHFRVRYDGALTFLTNRIDHFSAHSSAVMVLPTASLGRPPGYPKIGRRNKTYSVYGSLKPRQAASASTAKVVVIKCYRYERGKWRYKKSVNAKVYDYSTDSRYKASVKLTSAGSWRMRAYFKGSPTNAAISSSYRKVRVR